MIFATITTQSVNGRTDWYGASGQYRGRIYTAFEMTREAAFNAVLRQMAVAGAVRLTA